MKKIIITSFMIMSAFTINAQEAKQKESKATEAPASSNSQERAISEPGVSVKSEPKKSKSSAKVNSTATPVSNENKKETTPDAKKPE